MKYDFTTIYDRRGCDALAVDCPPPGMPRGMEPRFPAIPMWVADMSFATAPAVCRAIEQRLRHPLFGYFEPGREYYDAILRWQSRRNGVEGLEDRHIGYENGVLGGVLSALNVLCGRGDEVLLHAPTYIGFTSSLERNGLRIVHSPLARDENGVWRMDFEDMERKLRERRIHAAVFCSPHNPTGRVWERWEIERAMELFRKYDVYVVSDEIWSDLTLFDNRHIPTQSVSADARDRTVALYAPTKTFNLAGLVGSYHIIYNDLLRDRVERAGETDHYNEMNVLSMHALIGAYSDEGGEWADELRGVLSGNADWACRYIAERFHGVSAARPQGTYMLFPDCADWCAAHGATMDELLRRGYEAGVLWQDGRAFHGAHHIRINLALPKAKLEEAFERLDRYVFNAPEGR